MTSCECSLTSILQIHCSDDLYHARTFHVSEPITPHWKVLRSCNWHHSTPLDLLFLMVSFSPNFFWTLKTQTMDNNKLLYSMVFGQNLKILISTKNNAIGKSISREAEWCKFQLRNNAHTQAFNCCTNAIYCTHHPEQQTCSCPCVRTPRPGTFPRHQGWGRGAHGWAGRVTAVAGGRGSWGEGGGGGAS